MNRGRWVAAASVSITLHLGALATGLALVPHDREAILYIDLSVLVPAARDAESSQPLEQVRPIQPSAMVRAPTTTRRTTGAARPEPASRDHVAEPRPDQFRDQRARAVETEAPRLTDGAVSPLPAPPPAAPGVVATETAPRVEAGAAAITPSRAPDTALVDPSNLAPPAGGRAGSAADGRDGAGVPRTTPGRAGGPSDAASVAAGTSGSDHAGDADYAKYYSLLLRRIRDALEYPSSARRRNVSGTVQLEIVVRPDGTIGEVTVVASSSHAVLDDAAVEAARSIRPLPFPAGLRPRTLRARLPVVFELR